MPAKRKRPTSRTATRAAPAPRRARARAGGGATSTAAASPVRLITPAGEIALPWPEAGTKELGRLQHDAIEWTHLVRNRARWIGAAASAQQQDRRARELLQLLGVTEAQRRQIAEAGTVRVSIAWSGEERGWEARIIPWEYLLSAATRDLRTGSLLVSRWLLRPRQSRAPAFSKVLFVESAPGRLAQDWDFTQERRLVERYTKPTRFELLQSPTLDELRATVRRFHPDIVHLAGFDTHQGLELLKESRPDTVGDGYLMAGRTGVDPVPASVLADALRVAGAAPTLVTCNIWNSAARIAPLLVAAGVHSVIGIQDQVDDALGEMFLGNFYRSLSDSKSLETAFQDAWAALQAQPKPLRGTGIVLWNGGAVPESRAPVATRTATKTTTRARAETTMAPESVDSSHAREYIAVTVKPETQFSYGLLHNDRDLFREFLIRNLSDARLTGVHVYVELHSNEGTYPFRQSFTLDGPVLDLSRIVRVALTSTLARTLDEVLRTSLFVEVRWGRHRVYSQTFPVTMAPVDQWADTDADRIFLPSFVFPRDRAVRAVVKNAEQFMTALRDDPGAGFDGYQSLDPELENPAEPVDHQVQALWYSVVYRVPASYINPPPTYAVASQRIRTPSEIVAGGFGTCIDLALMMASCLEAIEVYPVLFILADHAFPGYWRTDAARTAFRTKVAAAPSEQGATATGEGPSARRRPGAPWCYDSAALVHIRGAITRNELVPLESVGLTARWSLGSAITEARGYFEPAEEDRFLLMLDVMTARESRVTPLPLGDRLGDRSNDRLS